MVSIAEAILFLHMADFGFLMNQQILNRDSHFLWVKEASEPAGKNKIGL